MPLNLQRPFIAAMAKQLPPSAARLRLLDVNGVAGPLLAQERDDLEIRPLPAAALLRSALHSFDAVAVYNIDLPSPFLRAALAALRPGGRFIAVQPKGRPSEKALRQLEAAGFVRILIEPAVDGIGLLLRGEKAHETADTQARIRSVAGAEADLLPAAQFKKPYLHLMIQQRPNKPVWKLTPTEKIYWRAAAIAAPCQPCLLAFSSLPKAVAFMQPALLAGRIRDINKVGRFRRETASDWPWPLLINPTLASIDGEALLYIDIDPATAEAPLE